MAKGFSSYNFITTMHHLKDLIVKGKYFIFIGFATLIQAQRNYYLPYTSTYKQLLKNAKEELKYIEPDTNHSQIQLQTLSSEQLNKLKVKTKKQISEIQHLKEQAGSTTIHTCTALGLGALNYFFNPTLSGFFVSSYLILLQVDLMKSLFVIKYGSDPLWKWKMKDCGYIINSAFAFLTFLVLSRYGLARLRERVRSKALVPQQSSSEMKGNKQQ